MQTSDSQLSSVRGPNPDPVRERFLAFVRRDQLQQKVRAAVAGLRALSPAERVATLKRSVRNLLQNASPREALTLDVRWETARALMRSGLPPGMRPEVAVGYRSADESDTQPTSASRSEDLIELAVALDALAASDESELPESFGEPGALQEALLRDLINGELA